MNGQDLQQRISFDVVNVAQMTLRNTIGIEEITTGINFRASYEKQLKRNRSFAISGQHVTSGIGNDLFASSMNIHWKNYSGEHENEMYGFYRGSYVNLAWFNQTSSSALLGGGFSVGKAHKFGNFIIELEAGLGAGVLLDPAAYASKDDFPSSEPTILPTLINIAYTFSPSFLNLNIGYQF